jgi:hypothetical protein
MSTNPDEFTKEQLTEACVAWSDDLLIAQEQIKKATKSKAARRTAGEDQIAELASQIATLENQLKWARARVAAIVAVEEKRARNYNLALAILGISIPALLCFLVFPYLGFVAPEASIGAQLVLSLGFATVPYGLSMLVTKYQMELSFWLPGNSFTLAYLIILTALPFALLSLFTFHASPTALELTKVLLTTIATLVSYFAIAFGLRKVCLK